MTEAVQNSDPSSTNAAENSPPPEAEGLGTDPAGTDVAHTDLADADSADEVEQPPGESSIRQVRPADADGPAVYEVCRSREVAAGIEETWLWLTRGERLTRWFADSGDLSEGGDFCFAFGDGDYFAGQVLETAAPERLRLRWRFMNLGRPFAIEFQLEPVAERGESGERTRVRVLDRGASSQAEAEGLEWGWGDFFDRLARAARSGENARYRWSEEVALGALAEVDPRPSLEDPDWWREAFPTARVEVESQGGDPASDERWRAVYRLRDPAWSDGGAKSDEGPSTEVRISYRTAEHGAVVTVGQKGFEALPESTQVAERKRYAEAWERALHPFEEGRTSREARS